MSKIEKPPDLFRGVFEISNKLALGLVEVLFEEVAGGTHGRHG